jgi:hypothetical protein
MASASAGPAIDIRSVINRDYLHEPLAFVNSVDHPVRTASRTPEALELETERFAHPLRRIRDMVNRLQYSRGGRFLESIEVAPCRRHDLNPPRV